MVRAWWGGRVARFGKCDQLGLSFYVHANAREFLDQHAFVLVLRKDQHERKRA